MTGKFIVQLHLGKYDNEVVGVYEYCKGFISPPFAGYDSAHQELAERQQNPATKISEEELQFLEKKTDISPLPGKKNQKQKEVEKRIREEYALNPNKILQEVFSITIDQEKRF